MYACDVIDHYNVLNRQLFTIYYGPYLIVKARKDDLMVVYIFTFKGNLLVNFRMPNANSLFLFVQSSSQSEMSKVFINTWFT